MFHSLNLYCAKLCFSAKMTVVSEKNKLRWIFRGLERSSRDSARDSRDVNGIRDLTATREAGVAKFG